MNKVAMRKTGKVYEEKIPKGANFLYHTFFGNIILSLVTKRFFSSFVGKYMDKKKSTQYINSFIKKNSIDMSDYPKKEYQSFNDFFSRKIIPSKRPLSMAKKNFISPADAKVLVYKIKEENKFNIKGKDYTLKEILRDEKLEKEYKNGYFLVFRLSVDDYHRYIFIDNGVTIKERKINGKFHTVGPVAFKKHKVFQENQREYSILKLENFGKIIQMEVGALMVGKIVNHQVKKFKRGQEKGYFLFGGSTIVIIVKENIIQIDKDILKNSLNNIETKVKQGEVIARKVGSSFDKV